MSSGKPKHSPESHKISGRMDNHKKSRSHDKLIENSFSEYDVIQRRKPGVLTYNSDSSDSSDPIPKRRNKTDDNSHQSSSNHSHHPKIIEDASSVSSSSASASASSSVTPKFSKLPISSKSESSQANTKICVNLTDEDFDSDKILLPPLSSKPKKVEKDHKTNQDSDQLQQIEELTSHLAEYHNKCKKYRRDIRFKNDQNQVLEQKAAKFKCKFTDSKKKVEELEEENEKLKEKLKRSREKNTDIKREYEDKIDRYAKIEKIIMRCIKRDLICIEDSEYYEDDEEVHLLSRNPKKRSKI